MVPPAVPGEGQEEKLALRQGARVPFLFARARVCAPGRPAQRRRHCPTAPHIACSHCPGSPMCMHAESFYASKGIASGTEDKPEKSRKRRRRASAKPKAKPKRQKPKPMPRDVASPTMGTRSRGKAEACV